MFGNVMLCYTVMNICMFIYIYFDMFNTIMLYCDVTLRNVYYETLNYCVIMSHVVLMR